MKEDAADVLRRICRWYWHEGGSQRGPQTGAQLGSMLSAAGYGAKCSLEEPEPVRGGFLDRLRSEPANTEG